MRRAMAVMVALSVALLVITVALGMLVRMAAFVLVAVQ